MQSQEQIKQAKNQQVDFVALARDAAAGNDRARKKINELAHPMIAYQTDRFCKRFCAENKYLYRCSLESPWGNAPRDALLCEWGNASYGWMLNDLTSENRLTRFKGTHGARIQDYLYRIANSLPFYERWKDWRFGRRIRVPDYVKDIDPDRLQDCRFDRVRSRKQYNSLSAKYRIADIGVINACLKINQLI